MTRESFASNVPLLIVFDLDFTLWYPEMYELAGAPFKRNKQGVVTDRAGEKVSLFDDVHDILHEIHTSPQYEESRIAVASRTHYPKWAKSCMQLLDVECTTAPNGSYHRMENMIQHEAIYPKDKVHHFRQLHDETGIDYKHMLFFDNAYYNIEDVGPLGVCCIHCPEGMTREHWKRGILAYQKHINKS